MKSCWTSPNKLDIIFAVLFVRFIVFDQQMHCIFVNNDLFLIALLHVSMFAYYARDFLLMCAKVTSQ
jgi:hypothetical protein